MFRAQCTNCNKVFVSASDKAFDCCDSKVRTKDVERQAIKKSSLHRAHFRASLPICRTNECGHYGTRSGSTGCLLMGRPCDIDKHLLNGAGCLADEPLFVAQWGEGLPVDDLDDDCLVITGSDRKYMRGVYFLAWTLLRTNNVRFRVYLDNVADDDPHVVQMKQWGVDFRPMPATVDRSVPFHQTWRKPASILDAMNDANRVLWLDSDMSVAASVRGAFNHIAVEAFTADHGYYEATNANGEAAHRFFGPPVREWSGVEFPCAGIVGFSDRDRPLVEEWNRRCLVTVQHRELWRADMHGDQSGAAIKYHDQGVLQDLWETDPVDGKVWNNFRVRRDGTVGDLMEQTYGYAGPGGHIICHYGGRLKPFLHWDAVLRWGSPLRRSLAGI